VVVGSALVRAADESVDRAVALARSLRAAMDEAVDFRGSTPRAVASTAAV
jgi:hypothetical protein